MNTKRLKSTIYESKYYTESKIHIIITTGIHGNEISPMFVGNKIIERFKDGFKLGNNVNLTLFNGVNLNGIYSNTREITDLIKNDMNRSFGKDNRDDITVSTLKHYVDNVAGRSDRVYIIDIHSSPRCNPVFLFDHRSDVVDHMIIECIDQNIPYAVWAKDTNSFKNYSARGVTFEIPGMGIEYDTASVVDLLFLFIDKLILSCEKGFEKITLDYNDLITPIISLYTGLVYWNTYPLSERAIYKKGSIIAEIKDFNNTLLSQIKMPLDGEIVDYRDRDFVIAGEELCSFQPEINLKEKQKQK